MKSSYKCSKCECDEYEHGEARMTGGFWSKIFDVQNRKFITISCMDCGYTEFYNARRGKTVENIFDFLTN